MLILHDIELFLKFLNIYQGFGTGSVIQITDLDPELEVVP
jgi:hypothetical protein